MTQIELNKLVAAAYDVESHRIDLISISVLETKTTMLPLHEDTLTLFKLCCKHRITIEAWDLWINVSKVHLGSFHKLYKVFQNEEQATCAAMFAALCKLKNIEEDGMSGYLVGLDRTGNLLFDAVLDMIEQAGDMYPNTIQWQDENTGLIDERSYIDRINEKIAAVRENK